MVPRPLQRFGALIATSIVTRVVSGLRIAVASGFAWLRSALGPYAEHGKGYEGCRGGGGFDRGGITDLGKFGIVKLVAISPMRPDKNYEEAENVGREDVRCI